MYRILSLAAGCLMLLCLQGICLAAEERVSLQPMCDLDGKTKDDLVKLREKSMIYSAFTAMIISRKYLTVMMRKKSGLATGTVAIETVFMTEIRRQAFG